MKKIINSSGPWPSHALQWNLISSPLRPCAEDWAVVQEQINLLSQQHSRINVLLFGVTQELVSLSYPKQARLLAVDCSNEMIQHHWHPKNESASVVIGQWEAMPVKHQVIDLALMDGSLNALSNVNKVEKALAQLAVVLKTGGIVVARVFLRPETRESMSAIAADIKANKVGNVHVAKWRIAHALHGALEEGVVLNDIWEAFSSLSSDLGDLTSVTGWSRESISTLKAYQHVRTKYVFPTFSEAESLFKNHFNALSIHTPKYELGDRCPTWILRLR